MPNTSNFVILKSCRNTSNFRKYQQRTRPSKRSGTGTATTTKSFFVTCDQKRKIWFIIHITTSLIEHFLAKHDLFSKVCVREKTRLIRDFVDFSYFVGHFSAFFRAQYRSLALHTWHWGTKQANWQSDRP